MTTPPDKIEQIRARADIVRIIGAHVVLKKQGSSRYIGLCPFHSEKSPSFSVSADKGLFYCFGCHARGDVFSFVEQIQGIEFRDAARWLGKEVGVDLEPESPAETKKRKVETRVAECNRYALAFFQHALWGRGGDRARSYLTSRAIPEEQARERGLGYGGAPGELIAYLIAKKVPEELARQAGMLNEAGDRCLFDERLIFPIVDQHGRIAGFAGRWLGETQINGERVRPKYVNSRESPLFSKRSLVYGWDVAQPAIRRGKRVVIVEGQTDVLACQRAGIEDAIAACGTAFTFEHAGLVKRLANDAVLLLDSDSAGERASREVAEKCVSVGLKTLIAPLPEGHDPDSFVRKNGPEALTILVKRAKPAIEHFIAVAFADAAMAVEDKARAAQALWPLFRALGQSLERDLYLARLAERVGINTTQLEQHLEAAERADKKTRKPEARSDNRESNSDEGRFDQGGERRFDDRSQWPTQQRTSPNRPPQTTKPAAAPSFDASELELVIELLLYPSLRPRFSELVPFASAPMHPILEDLASAAEPAAVVLERHNVGARWVKRAGKLDGSGGQGPAVGVPSASTISEGVVPPGIDSATDSTYGERLERTFNDVLVSLKARQAKAVKKALLVQVHEARARGDATEHLEQQLKDLTRQSLRLKRAGQQSSSEN